MSLDARDSRAVICISDSEPDEPLDLRAILSPARKQSAQPGATPSKRSTTTASASAAKSYSYLPETPSSKGKGNGRRLTITSIHDSSSDELDDLCSKALDLTFDSDSDIELVRPIQCVLDSCVK